MPNELNKELNEQQGAIGNFFKKPVEGKDYWQFFNPKFRNWAFISSVQNQNGIRSLVLRDGWIIRKLGKRDDAHSYYKCMDGTLTSITREEASEAALHLVDGIFYLPFAEKDNLIYVKTKDIFLPWKQFNLLSEIACHLRRSEGLIEIMVFQSQDKCRVLEILKQAKASLILKEDFIPLENVMKDDERTVYKKLLKQLSETFSLAYSDFLKKEDCIEDFILTIAHRDWSRISEPELRKNLEQLVTLVDQGNRIAIRLFHFIVNELPTFFDWQLLNSDFHINGVVIDGAPLEFQRHWSTNYYKVIVPELETSLYWQTTLSPSSSGIGYAHSLSSRLQGIRIRRWRVYPYLGKLRLTGDRQDVLFEEKDHSQLKKAFGSLIGIPSFELLLKEYGYLDGYNLDCKTWRGGYSFTRNFLAMVKIEEGIDPGYPNPTTLVTDIFGNHFGIQWDIENYLHEADIISRFQRNGWISVLVENELNSIDPDYEIPIFRSAQTIGPRFITKADAILQSIIGLIRYCGFISNEGLQYLGINSIDRIEFQKDVEILKKEKRIIENNGFCFYVHNSISAEQASEIAELTLNPEKILKHADLEKDWYRLWSLLRVLFPYIHPLIRGDSIFDSPIRASYPSDKEEYSKLYAFVKGESRVHEEKRMLVQKKRLSFLVGLQKPNIEYFDTYIGDKEISRYLYQASLMLRNFGQATIKARGRWISKAHKVAQELIREYAYADPKITRIDKIDKAPDGRCIPSVEFNVITFG